MGWQLIAMDNRLEYLSAQMVWEATAYPWRMEKRDQGLCRCLVPSQSNRAWSLWSSGLPGRWIERQCQDDSLSIQEKQDVQKWHCSSTSPVGGSDADCPSEGFAKSTSWNLQSVPWPWELGFLEWWTGWCYCMLTIGLDRFGKHWRHNKEEVATCRFWTCELNIAFKQRHFGMPSRSLPWAVWNLFHQSPHQACRTVCARYASCLCNGHLGKNLLPFQLLSLRLCLFNYGKWQHIFHHLTEHRLILILLTAYLLLYCYCTSSFISLFCHSCVQDCTWYDVYVIICFVE